MLRQLALLLLTLTFLWAEKEFDATLTVSTHRPVVREPVMLRLHIRKYATDKLLSFEFEPPKSEKYSIKLLESTEKSLSGYDESTFTYALFPLQSGRLTLRFHYTAKEATQAEVKKFVTGSADELTYLRTTDRVIDLKPITLEVLPLAEGTKLVGDFALTQKIDKHRIEPDEQVNLTYILKGRGYQPDLASPLQISGVESFLSHEHFEEKLFYKEIYRYALLSDHNFTIPALSIKAYNPQTKRYYTLTTDAEQITVEPTLAPKKRAFTGERLLSLMKEGAVYLLFLIGGLFTALILQVRQNGPEALTERHKRIERAKHARELLQIALAYGSETMESEIRQLEEAVYGNQTISLKRVKKEILRKLET